MSSMLFIVMLCFFVPGVAYGSAIGKYNSANDVIAAVVKTFAGLGGLIHVVDDQPVHRLLQLPTY